MTDRMNVDMPTDVELLRVVLPGRIGHVDINTGLINRDTQGPVIVIEVQSSGRITADGHVYAVSNDWKDGRVRMVGQPARGDVPRETPGE